MDATQCGSRTLAFDSFCIITTRTSWRYRHSNKAKKLHLQPGSKQHVRHLLKVNNDDLDDWTYKGVMVVHQASVILHSQRIAFDKRLLPGEWGPIPKALMSRYEVGCHGTHHNPEVLPVFNSVFVPVTTRQPMYAHHNCEALPIFISHIQATDVCTPKSEPCQS